MREDGEASVLEALVERWFSELEAGREPDPEELCRAHPELLADLLRIVSWDETAADALRAWAATEPELAGSPALPESIGEFRIESRLGSGGMGDVYLATQASLGRRVALKVLRSEGEGDTRSRLRFRREAEIAAALDHPNVVPIYAIGENEGRPWLAMKWLQGPSLDRLPEALPPREVARLGSAVASALHEAHLSGVIHRDVKPANVILDDGEPFVVDFGLARVHRAATLTREGGVAGTLAYMSPEQLRGGRHALDPRTDVYSLGATLYELATGRPPFQERDPEALVAAVMLREPEGLAGRGSGAGRDLDTVLAKAMEKDRERRFLSAGELAEELGRIARGEPILSRRVGIIGRLGRRIARHPRTAAAIGSFALLALVALSLWIAGEQRRERRFESGVRGVREATSDGRLALADSLLRTLRRAHPERKEITELERLVRGREALESLLDRVQDRQEIGTLPGLEGAVRRVLDLGGEVFDPRGVRLVQCLVCVLREEPERARTLLDGLLPGRDVDAFRLLVDDTSAWTPPGRIDVDALSAEQRQVQADRHVFAAVALRVAERSPQERAAEIDRARELVLDHYRAANARAILLAERGEHRLAQEAFLALTLSGRARPSVHRNLGRLAMILGDLPRARRELDRVRDAEASAVQRVLEADLLERTGDVAGATALLDAALTDHPDDPQLLLARARRAGLTGDTAAARRDLERALAAARLELLRTDAAIALFFLDLRALPVAGRVRRLEPDELAVHGKALQSLTSRVGELLDRVEGPGQRAELLAGRARLQRLLGETKASWESLDAALASEDSRPAARGLVAAIALQDAMDLRNRRPAPREDREWAGNWNALFAAGLEHAEAVRAGRSKGMRPPTQGELRGALIAASYLAVALRKEELAEDRIQEALDFLEGSDDAEDRRWRDLLLRMLDRLGER